MTCAPGRSQRRVLHIITRSELGGAQRYLAELAARQRSCGWSVSLLTGEGGWLTQQPNLFDSVDVIPELVRDVAPRRDVRALKHLTQELRVVRYDVVHTHSSKAGVLGRIAASIARVPLIAHTSHGIVLGERLTPSTRLVYMLAEQAAAAVTDRFFAVSETEKRTVRRSIITRPGALRTMTIVPKYLRIQRDGWNIEKASRTSLVAVGNLYRTKAYDVLLEAVAQLAAKHPALTVAVLGEGPERAVLEDLSRRLGLQRRIRWLGRVSDPLPHVVSAAAFVLPSRKEGLPFALLEALALGTPVISTRVGAVPELLGDSPFLVSPDRPAEFAAAVDALLSSDALRLEAGRSSRCAFGRALARDNIEAVCGMYS